MLQGKRARRSNYKARATLFLAKSQRTANSCEHESSVHTTTARTPQRPPPPRDTPVAYGAQWRGMDFAGLSLAWLHTVHSVSSASLVLGSVCCGALPVLLGRGSRGRGAILTLVAICQSCRAIRLELDLTHPSRERERRQTQMRSSRACHEGSTERRGLDGKTRASKDGRHLSLTAS